jgi:hypothetical protein
MIASGDGIQPGIGISGCCIRMRDHRQGILGQIVGTDGEESCRLGGGESRV